MLKSNLFDLNGIKRLFAPSRCILLRVWTIINTRARKYVVRCVRPTRHTSGCLSEIKTSPGHLISHGGSYQASYWQECASNRLSRHSFLHCPSRPVPHGRELPIPTPPNRDQPFSGDGSKSDSEEDIGDPDCVHICVEERRPYFANQKDVNDQIGSAHSFPRKFDKFRG